MNNPQTETAPSPRNFLWWCAGAVPEVLRMYPSEKAKYEGIGGAVLSTGVLAFFSGFYAIYTTLASGSWPVLTSRIFRGRWRCVASGSGHACSMRWRECRPKATWLPPASD